MYVALRTSHENGPAYEVSLHVQESGGRLAVLMCEERCERTIPREVLEPLLALLASLTISFAPADATAAIASSHTLTFGEWPAQATFTWLRSPPAGWGSVTSRRRSSTWDGRAGSIANLSLHDLGLTQRNRIN